VSDDQEANGSGVDDALLAFVPRLAVELGAKPVPSWTSVDGSMLSADISGFTALSEKLAGKGKAGAEEITELINTCFTALIDSAYRYGGEVLKFGGDALLILFRDDNHERRCADAGLLMQRALHSSPAAKRANLTMTVGAAAGPFDVFLVGSGYRELLVTGPRATEVIRLEGEAAKGDTLIDPIIAALLPNSMKLREESGGWVVTGSTGDDPSGPRLRDHGHADLSPYVPAAVTEQLAAFAELGGEHRLVTVGFTMVVGVAEQLDRLGPAGVAEALGLLVDDVVEACDAYGVTVLHTDIAPDGIKFVLCAGAPVSPGDTTDALLQAALQIAASEVPLTIRQGVQAGRVFAGFLGSLHRRTYTLMGDPVNTAARMLGKAADREIVAVASAVDDTRAVFETELLEPFLVKGKTEPITAAKVRGATGNVRRDIAGTRLVGRERELEILTRAIGELDTVVELVGLAGVGKSRLLDAAWSAAEGLTIYQGACTPYGAASPYSVFRPLMRSGSGIPIDASAELTGNRLSDIVAEFAPNLVPMLPLLALPFGARVPSTPEADAIDPEFRRDRVHDVVVQFLDIALTGPILLVVEDTHWIDDASGELLNHFVQASHGRPWAAIITRRPEGDWVIPDADHVVSIDLQPLDDDAIRQLAVEVSTRPLADRDLDVVAERAQGNPLFAVELARALAESSDDTELPDTIEQIIASRFDRLDPSARRLIRVASVLGNVFHEVIVGAMLAELDHDADVDGALAEAMSSGAITRRPGSRWAFNHALYRDTAYQGLPFNRRKHLHRLAAQTIEDRAVDTSAAAPVLSLHYSVARAHEQAWRYSLQAAEAAEEQNATAEAAVALARALESGRYCRTVDRAARSRVAEQLADHYYLLGRFGDADQLYRKARLGNTDELRDVDLMRKLGTVQERRGTSQSAVRWLRRAARSIPPNESSEEWMIAAANVALAEASVRARQDDNAACIKLGEFALVAADKTSDTHLRALALEKIHLGLVGLVRPDTEGTGPRALEAHRRVGDHAGAARTLINLGVEAYYESRWTDAAQSYLEAIDEAERTGSTALSSTAALNSAEILCDQGHWERSLPLFDDAIRNYEAMGYQMATAAARLFSSVAAMRLGRLDLAAERLAAATSAITALGTDLADDLDSRQLELDLLVGSAGVDQCRLLHDQLGAGHPLRTRTGRCLAGALMDDGDNEAAAEVLAAELASPACSGFERALASHTLLGILPNAADAPDLHDEIQAIFTSLGIVRVPPLRSIDLSSQERPSESSGPAALSRTTQLSNRTHTPV
jgi:class 3 adenylate cyclase/tetratricopeptide (TPR) repeat protein